MMGPDGIYRLPTVLREVPSITTAHTGHPQSNCPYDWPAPEGRYGVRAFIDGSEVFDTISGDIISRCHGGAEALSLAWRIAKSLNQGSREDAARHVLTGLSQPDPPEAA